MTPYYEHAGITIYHGDCLQVVGLVPFDDVDLLLADPPYGIDFDTDYTRFTTGFDVERKIHKPIIGDSNPFDPTPWLRFKRVILWGANCFSDKLPRGSWLIWDKRHANGTAFLADAEAAWTNHGTGIYIYSQTWQGCLRSDPIDHPTQKPVNLMAWCLARVPSCQLVLDPYMGVGTTLVAAKAAGIAAIGIEIEERYCEIAAKRLSQEVLPFADLDRQIKEIRSVQTENPAWLTAMGEADLQAERHLLGAEEPLE